MLLTTPKIRPCKLCSRVRAMTRHHLFPRHIMAQHAPGPDPRKKQVVYLCAECHAEVHSRFTNEELFHRFNRLETLKSAVMAHRAKFPF